MNVSEVLQRALGLHQAGQLDQAEELYRRILKKKPKLADAHNLLGVLLQQKGDLDGAVKHTRRATQLDPKFHVPFVNLGNALQAAGQHEDAAAAFRRADQLAPGQPEILNNLASVLNAQEKYEEALAAAADAMRLNANMGEAYNNEGNALLGLGRPEDALVSFQRALSLGAPTMDVAFNIGQAQAALGRHDEARETFTRITVANPADPRVWFHLADADLALDDFDAAIGGFEEALALDPGFTAAECNLAAALQAKGDTEGAIARLEDALTREPEAADLRWNLALARLQHGDFERGWRDYEARWDTPSFASLKARWRQPNWDGGDINGKTLLVRAEQGFGDAIQFCRYLPLVAAKGARVVVECRPGLGRLLAGLDGVAATVDLGEDLPDHDLQVPLMSLPGLFAATLATVPAEVPYLAVPADVAPDPRVAAAPGLKVGFAWQGSATRRDNAKRSVPLDRFEALFAQPGARFFSLQVGPGQAALAARRGGPEVADLAETIEDFADTAANVAALDLVITVDTAVLHLAGALGRPVWGLLSRPAGYLYMTEGETSPWYPTLRLFRQPTPGDWDAVFAAAREELEKLAA